jgi:hypothetical protein
MNEFKELLEKQMLKAKAASGSAERETTLRSSAPSAPTEVDGKAEDTKSAAPRSVRSARREQQVEDSGETRPLPRNPPTPTNANVNRVTVNLFDTDRRALAVIKEMLGTTGHDFTNRSDSIKVALRIAAKARREELAEMYEQVKAEDRRFRSAE